MQFGSYRKVHEARLIRFHSCSYPEIEAAALARPIVAQPLPEVARSCSPGYFETIVPLTALFCGWFFCAARRIYGT